MIRVHRHKDEVIRAVLMCVLILFLAGGTLQCQNAARSQLPVANVPSQADQGAPARQDMTMVFWQFRYNLEHAQSCLDSVHALVDEARPWWALRALEQATDAINHYSEAEGTYRVIVAHENAWKDEYAKNIAEARKLWREARPDVMKKEVGKLPKLRRELFLRLSAAELVRVYQRVIGTSWAMPNEGAEVDIRAELEQRRMAASALLARIADPQIADRWDTKKPEEEHQMVHFQIRWCIGYEVLARESEWLLSFVPNTEKQQYAKLVEEIKAGLPTVKHFLEETSPKKYHTFADFTYSTDISSIRDAIRLDEFPKLVRAVAAQRTGPGSAGPEEGRK